VADVSAAPKAVRAVAEPGAAASLAGAPAQPAAARAAARLGAAWLGRIAWALGRTGRPGLLGLALLGASGVFLASTYRPAAAEVEELRGELSAARARPGAPSAAQAAGPAARVLPARGDTPGILRRVFSTATQAQLAVDTGRYEVRETHSGGVVRTHVTFPVTGPYPQIRRFLDTMLATMPAVALSQLALERKAISEGEVEAQLQVTIYTAAAGGGAPAASPPGAEARAAPGRVVPPAHAAALFAQHTWAVIVPVKLAPPPPPPPPPEPTAPPLPFTFVGSYGPAGAAPVYFLARGDAVVDAHVGDKLDGVWLLESADGAQLVFLYLPLNLRQTIPAGASK
jgi:hypothetical protein